MTTSARAQWLIERRDLWCGLSPRETILGDLSPRVVDLVTGMREADLFPDYWDETEVLFAFLGAVAEARTTHRRRYSDAVRASDRDQAPGRPYAHRRTMGRKGFNQ